MEELKKDNTELLKVGKIRKVFLDNLPRYRYGKTHPYGIIDWQECARLKCKVRFIYDDIEGEVEIADYDKSNHYISIIYECSEPHTIKTSGFTACKLGKLLGKVTKDFKVEIGTRYKDNKRDMVIMDREYRLKANNKYSDKWYKYKCNKCGWTEGWVVEVGLLKGYGCSCCCSNPRDIVQGINDVPTTAPWMVKFFQGGHDEARLYTCQSTKSMIPICPDCGRIKDKSIRINQVYNNKSIGCNCGDGKSYPEKFMFLTLEQLKLNFKSQLARTDFRWCKGYKYDFYFKYNDNEYIIEINGRQHYEDNGGSFEKTLEEQKDIDRLKKELALKNGIKEDNYIVIDCRKSGFNFIKEKIIKSKLSKLFNLSNINWFKCEEFALSNLVKEACEIKKNNPVLSTLDIANTMKIARNTITKYLNLGCELGWCDYNPKEEMILIYEKNAKRSMEKFSKSVEIFKDEISLGVFKSGKEIERQSENLFGVKLFAPVISEVCNNKKPQYKGFTFKFTS